MTEPTTIVNDIEDLATVERAHVHQNGDSAFAVIFHGNTVPTTFQRKMLSEGYAVSHIDACNELTVVFTNITEF